MYVIVTWVGAIGKWAGANGSMPLHHVTKKGYKAGAIGFTPLSNGLVQMVLRYPFFELERIADN